MTQLDQLSEKERAVALRILKQMKDSGSSKIYDKLLYQDYEEVPVDIKTFLHDPRYLGKGLVNEEGKFTVFKYWEDLLCNKIFPDPLKPCTYNTLALTGGIGLGKSFVAVICMLYDLYRMLCLKDPYLHYGLQPIDLITFAVMNITMDAARGVAWDKLQLLLQSSPWFMSHGSMKGTTNPTWVPPKGIELLYGSLPRHIIGRAVFSCLDGDTVVVTSDGEFKIKDLVDKPIRVYNLSDSGDLQLSEICTAKQTDSTDTEYQIELENGEVVKCTPTHRFMLKDGTYKMAKDLTESDELADVDMKDNTVTYSSFIGNIIKTRGQWSADVKAAGCERHHIIPRCLGGEPQVMSWKPHENIIWLTPAEHFIAHKLLAEENPNSRSLISAWLMMAFPKGKTGRKFDRELLAEEYAELKELHRNQMRLDNPSLRKTGHPWNYGLSKEADPRVRKYAETCSKNRSGKKVVFSPEHLQHLREALRKRLSEHPEFLKAGHNKGKKAFTNGQVTIFLAEDEEVPQGFESGNCNTAGKHDMSNYYTRDDLRQHRKEISSGENNNMYGKGYKVSGGKNGHATMWYKFNGAYFDCRNDLIYYLNSCGYDIKASHIRKLINNNLSDRLTNKYKNIIDQLTWGLKDENKIN